MRRKKHRRHGKSDVNVTPLLDVVFIMLIFFVVTASFIKEASIDLGRFDSPMKSSAASKGNNIFIAISNDGRIWINRRAVSIDALRPNLEKLHADNSDAKLIIVPEPNSTTDVLVRVIDTARVTGIGDVSIAGG